MVSQHGVASQEVKRAAKNCLLSRTEEKKKNENMNGSRRKAFVDSILCFLSSFQIRACNLNGDFGRQG